MRQLAGASHVWTFDDLQGLPETAGGSDVDWRRYEIVEGALVVSPAANPRHEIVSARLLVRLAPVVPAGHEVVGPLSVDLAPSYLNPDLLVIPSSRFDGPALVQPSDVLLAVEIVSPSSRTMDRVVKPAAYAAGGIANYWRVETEPAVTLTAYRLAPADDAYAEIGTWGTAEVAELDHPFPVRIPIDALIPRP